MPMAIVIVILIIPLNLMINIKFNIKLKGKTINKDNAMSYQVCTSVF